MGTHKLDIVKPGLQRDSRIRCFYSILEFKSKLVASRSNLMYNENNKVAMAIKASAFFHGDFAAINLIAVFVVGAHLIRF